MAKLTALGLFSGCGGLDLGAQRAGFEIIGAFDLDETAIATYRRNISQDAQQTDLTEVNLSVFKKNTDLVLGGPPCQGFSSAGPKIENDSRNKLWKSYLRAIAVIKPKAFLVENVYGFARELPAFKSEIERVFDGAYNLDYKKINSQFYGIPQQRLRLFFIGIHKDFAPMPAWPEPLLPEVSNQLRGGGWRIVPGMRSLESALSDLGPAEPFTNLRERTWGAPHKFVPLEPSHAEIAPHIPNGGSLRNIPDHALPKNYRGRQRTRKGWAWYYRKPNPSLPARTVTASLIPIYSQVLAPDVFVGKRGKSWTWSPVESANYTDSEGLYTSPVGARRLSLKEIARLQTFPDSFEFFGTPEEITRQIGNAVPVGLAEMLSRAIGAQLINGKTEYAK